MADERPPSWVPVDQHVGQVPLALSQDIDISGVPPNSGQDTNKLATQIIRDNQPVINRFIAMQRQQVEIGEKDVHSSVLPLKDMNVYYQNMQGIERVHYHINPKVEEPSEPPTPSEEIKLPEPPAPEEPPETPEIETPKPEVPEPPEPPPVPEPPEPPELEEPELPELPEPPEEKPPEEEEEPKKELKEPEFLEIDVACYLAVIFGDKEEDAPKGDV